MSSFKSVIGNTFLILFVVFMIVLRFSSFESDENPEHGGRQRQVNLARRGGSPTIRRDFVPDDDDPTTSNDESNDQPLGHFGTISLKVCNLQSGNCYPLDGELTGSSLNRLYFPKGGWVDFSDCELEEDMTGECVDENGKSWRIEGEY